MSLVRHQAYKTARRDGFVLNLNFTWTGHSRIYNNKCNSKLIAPPERNGQRGGGGRC